MSANGGSRQLKITIVGDASSAEKAMAATAQGAAKLDLAIGGIGEGFKKATAGVGALGAALSGAGIGLALKAVEGVMGAFGALKGSVIDTNAALESSKQGWTILLGGAEAAEAQIQSLYKFAATTPFEFGEVDKAARLLETFGGKALNTSENLTLVGDIAAGVDQPFSDVATWVGRMYSAMQNGQPFGEAAARLQEMGALSGEARTKLEQLQKEGATGPALWAEFNKTMGRFSGTMKAQSGTWAGLQSTIQDTFNQLAATAGKPLFDFAQKGLAKFAAALSDPRVAAFAELIAGKLTVALDTVGRIIAAAWPPLQRFLGGIFSAGKAVIEATQAFLTGKTNLGQFIGGLEIMFGSVLGNISGLFAGLGEKIGPPLAAFGGKVVEFLGALLPQIGAQLQIWGQKFGDWVQETAWPALQAKLGELAAALGQWIVGTALPAARDKLGELGKAFGTWVVESAVPNLLAQLGAWLGALGGWFTGTAVPAVVGFFKTVAEKFVDWISGDAIPNLLRSIPQWIIALDVWIVTEAIPTVIKRMAEIAKAFVDWIGGSAVPWLKENLPKIANQISAWVGAFVTEFIPWAAGQFARLGGALVEGIIQGLRDAWPKIRAALEELAKTLPDPIKSVLGISSPSRVFAEQIGAPIAEGIVAGILSRRPALDRALGDLVTLPGTGVAAVGPTRTAGRYAAGTTATTGGGDISYVVNFNFPNLVSMTDRRQVQEAAADMRRVWNDIVRGGSAGRGAGV